MDLEFNEPVMLSPFKGKHHFFGYYGICPWNQGNEKLVCLEVDFHDRMPLPGESANILHWLPESPTKIIFNDCKDGIAISRVSVQKLKNLDNHSHLNNMALQKP